MGTWYEVAAAIPVTRQVVEKKAFKKAIEQMYQYIDRESLEIVNVGRNPIVMLVFNGETLATVPSKIKACLVRLGKYATCGVTVEYRNASDAGVFFIGPSAQHRRQARMEHHLAEIRSHLNELGINHDDPCYGRRPTAVDDVIGAIQAMVRNRNILVVGSYPDTNQYDVVFIVEADNRSDALDLVSSIQTGGLADEIEVVCPEAVKAGFFQPAAFYNTRDLIADAARLLHEPNIRIVSKASAAVNAKLKACLSGGDE